MISAGFCDEQQSCCPGFDPYNTKGRSFLGWSVARGGQRIKILSVPVSWGCRGPWLYPDSPSSLPAHRQRESWKTTGETNDVQVPRGAGEPLERRADGRGWSWGCRWCLSGGREVSIGWSGAGDSSSTATSGLGAGCAGSGGEAITARVPGKAREAAEPSWDELITAHGAAPGQRGWLPAPSCSPRCPFSPAVRPCR